MPEAVKVGAKGKDAKGHVTERRRNGRWVLCAQRVRTRQEEERTPGGPVISEQEQEEREGRWGLCDQWAGDPKQLGNY